MSYVFKDFNKNQINVFIVTNYGKVSVFQNNSYGVLRFGNQIEVNELTFNEELSHKQIIDFKNSKCDAIARTIDRKVFG
jgi:hypothetical protein